MVNIYQDTSLDLWKLFLTQSKHQSIPKEKILSINQQERRRQCYQ